VPTRACNGQTGFTETLPPGETETGAFGIATYVPASTIQEVQIPISFPIPLEDPSEEAFYLNLEETEEGAGTHGCTGTVEHPTAPPGVLCMYTAQEEGSNFPDEAFPLISGVGYQPAGTVLRFFSEEFGQPSVLQVNGTWAVTAPPAAP